MPNPITITVNGKEFSGWTDVSIECAKQKTSSSATLQVSFGKGQAEAFQNTQIAASEIQAGRDCTIKVLGELVITGFIKSRKASIGPEKYALTVEVESKTGKLRHNSVDHKTGQWNKKKGSEIAKDIISPSKVELDHDLSDEHVRERHIVRKGENVERALQTIFREHGHHPTDNEHGKLVVKKAGYRGKADNLTEGLNIHTAEVTHDFKVRHKKVHAHGGKVQHDKSYGKDAHSVSDNATDSSVKDNRTLHIRVDGDTTKARLKKRAKMELHRRNAEGVKITVAVFGFAGDSGKIWRPDTKAQVKIPTEGVDDTFLIESVTFECNSTENYETSIVLVPTKAYSDGSDEAKSSGSAPSKSAGVKEKPNKVVGSDDLTFGNANVA